MTDKQDEERSGFDTIYYFARDLVKRTPLRWWVWFLFVGAVLAHIVPAESWISVLWDKYIISERLFWLSALILGSVTALFFAYVRRKLLEDRTFTNDHVRNRSTKHFLLDDVALRENEPDELERTQFAEAIAPLLVLPKKAVSVVVALEAGWGEGKSSVLTLIERELDCHIDNPIVVRFNPWFVHSREQVLRSFFSHLISEIDSADTSATAAVENLRSYARALQSLSSASAGTALLGFLDFRLQERSLLDEKRRLSSVLEKIQRPVVVVIDDIDRLPKKDIRCIFQLVKIVCDFPRFSYLLAFDPMPVDQALEFDGLYLNGQVYREKIVQLSVKLPIAGFGVRRRYFQKRIQERIDAWTLEPTSEDNQTLDKFTVIAVRGLQTPREMKRLLNSWCLACNQLKNEVNFGDVLLMELLLMKFPAVFRAIQSEPRRLVGDGILTNDFEALGMATVMQTDGQSGKERRQNLRNLLLKLHPTDAEHLLLADVLEMLFPNAISTNLVIDDTGPLNRRVRDRDTLEIYFGRRLPSGAMSMKDIKQFYEDTSGRAGILEDAIKSRALGACFVFLERDIQAPVNPEDFVRRICDAVQSSWAVNRDNNVDDADNLLIAILKRVDTACAREMMEALVTDPATAVVGERVIGSILGDMDVRAPFQGYVALNESSYHGEWISKFPLVLMREMVIKWLETVRSSDLRELIETKPNFMSVLFRWGQFESPQYESVRAALARYIVDSDTATKFSYGFAPQNGIAMGIDGVEKLLPDPKAFVQFLQHGSPLVSVLERFIEKFSDTNMVN